MAITLDGTTGITSPAETVAGAVTAASVAATGAVSGTTGTFTGAVSGTTGTFTSAVSGTTGTFTGAVSGTTGTFTGAVSGTTGTFTGAVNSTNTFGFKNRIFNGEMVIDQRNAGASVTPASTPTYTIDRWNFQYTANSKFSTQRSTTVPSGFTNSMLVTSLSAYSVVSGDIFLVQQSIEGFNTADLAWGTASAATVTLSFWVRSSLTGTFGGALLNSSQDRNYPFTYSISVANTWEQKTVTIVGDTSGTWTTDNSAGIRVTFGLGGGATYSGTAGAWAAGSKYTATGATSVVGTNGATFYITGVQLEKGSTATSFDYRPYGTELALCQRYYEIITCVAGGQAGNWVVTGFFKVTKRVTPTSTRIGNYYSGGEAGTTVTDGNEKQLVLSVTGNTFVGGICTVSAEL